MNWWRRAFISEEDLDISGQSSTDCISLVIYDITDDKRRGKLFATLKKYGVQVQKSAFECRISEEKNKLMLKQLTSIINKNMTCSVYTGSLVITIFNVGVASGSWTKMTDFG